MPQWDTLNLRAWPSSGSKILVAYPNGVILSMTGKCTGGVKLDTINGWPKWKQRETVRYQWCEAWIDPTGNGTFRTAWVYGKYIAPLCEGGRPPTASPPTSRSRPENRT